MAHSASGQRLRATRFRRSSVAARLEHEVRLTAADVVRHPLVQRIIDAYKGRERAGNGNGGGS